jgi:ABC-type maltose transport system permease subunit
MDEATMYRVIQSYMESLPGALKEIARPDGMARETRFFLY